MFYIRETCTGAVTSKTTVGFDFFLFGYTSTDAMQGDESSILSTLPGP